MKIIDLEQRSEEWVRWRSVGLGGSDAAAVVGVSPWVTREELLAQKRAAYWQGKTPGGEESGAMRRGRLLEPLVLAEYEALVGWPVRSLCAVHGEHDFIKASFDGISCPSDDDAKGMILDGAWAQLQGWVSKHPGEILPVEIKCPNRNAHLEALAGRVPEYYVPQCHHLMLVSGAEVLHYVSYSNYFPAGRRLAVVSLRATPEELAGLRNSMQEFWQEVVTPNVVSQAK